MKNYNKINHYLFLVCMIILSSCSSDDNSSVANQVQATTTNGAALRTISINQGTFNYTNTASEWSATVEIQGGNLSQLKLYATHVTDSGSSAEKYVKTFLPSIFTTGSNGYPRGDVSVSLAETLTALDLIAGQYAASDKFILRFELILTDGRVFSSANSGATVTGGSYFSSPFEYAAQFSCPLSDASIFNGTYTVVADAWQDYVPGDAIPVVYDPSDGPFTFRILSTNNPYILNAATSYIKVTVDPATNDVTVQSNEDFNYGGGFIVDVTGDGSVGSCTGDINVKLDFSGSSQNQTLSLIKN